MMIVGITPRKRKEKKHLESNGANHEHLDLFWGYLHYDFGCYRVVRILFFKTEMTICARTKD